MVLQADVKAGSGASGMIEQKDEDGLVDDNGDTAVAVGSADQEEGEQPQCRQSKIIADGVSVAVRSR